MKFSEYNPKACLLFFIFAVILTLSSFNPYFLLPSLICALIYNFMLQGKKTVKAFFGFLLPFTALIGIFNMIFASYGVTELFKIGEKSFSLEPLCYGLCQGVMFSSVIVWLSSYSLVMSSEKFMSVFSRVAPNITLTLTMALSFLPRLRKNAREINDARKNIKNENKIKKSINNFSALVSMTLEESIDVSDSMTARGFNKNRRAYSKYAFSLGDGVICALMTALFTADIVMAMLDFSVFIFDPEIKSLSFSYTELVFYAALLILPTAIDIKEDIRWFFLKRKI